ncbi:hypothetical protein J6590_047562 [Homalodisca vitripennis]|nr:hypothetical protein J6590_047562 [Homalodisca vitripennis]
MLLVIIVHFVAALLAKKEKPSIYYRSSSLDLMTAQDKRRAKDVQRVCKVSRAVEYCNQDPQITGETGGGVEGYRVPYGRRAYSGMTLGATPYALPSSRLFSSPLSYQIAEGFLINTSGSSYISPN